MSLHVDLNPHWNLFIGPNGAGKTSLLEAAYLLSHGRSFRSASRDVLARYGSRGYSVYGEVALAESDSIARVGVSREGARSEARMDGDTVTLASLLRRVAVLCFEPGSHALISGPADERRRFLDWGVFHVEHEFLDCWRRYHRALKQRNAALRSGGRASDLDVWDHELAAAAEPLLAQRERYFIAWRSLAVELLAELLPELGTPNIVLHPGFDSARALQDVLAQHRSRDIERGHTTCGPHRSDWSLVFSESVRREHLSRGQAKLSAFACVMAQARLHARASGEWPILCLDDIASEIDADHRRRVLDVIDGSGAQVLVTATEPSPQAFGDLNSPITLFHVEQGQVATLV